MNIVTYAAQNMKPFQDQYYPVLVRPDDIRAMPAS